MIDDPITESAKAVQEVAKATQTGLEVTQNLGGFLSKIIGRPMEVLGGILEDRFQFVRWERQVRFREKANEIIEAKNLKELRVVPPKLALPIFENAVLEENDELQDLWANLLASAVDPKFDEVIRSAYIDIIRQLEVADVHILQFAYKHLRHEVDRHNEWIERRPYFTPEDLQTPLSMGPETVEVTKYRITERLGLSLEAYKASVDNLLRVGCISHYVETQKIEIPAKEQYISTRVEMEKVPLTFSHTYDAVCLTSLGVGFISACIKAN